MLCEYENIGGPWTAANEPCRRRNRRVKQGDTAMRGSFVGRLSGVLRDAKSSANISKRTFLKSVHIHAETYYSDYERCHGPEKVAELKERKELWESRTDRTSPGPAKWKPGPENHEHPAIQQLHVDYYSKGTKPPINTRIIAYKTAGYPESWLLKMLTKHERVERTQAETDKWFDLVMGPYANKKESVPKPKTLKQIFKIKPVKAIMPDLEEE
tara:strand:+ start:133 stop:771 length:639 start_codon:yes stop_codon:yes gene_type:complete